MAETQRTPGWTEGVIRPTEMYTLDEVYARTRKNKRQVGQALKDGMKSYSWGTGKYIMGEDLIEWLKKGECHGG